MSNAGRSRFSLMRGVPFWAFAVLSLLGLVLVALSVSQIGAGWRLARDGVQVAGTVTGLNVTQESCGKDNLDTCTRHWVTYAFQDAGRVQTRTEQVAQSFYAGLEQGGPVAVRFVPGDTSVSEVDIGTGMIAAVALALLGLAIGGAGGVGLGWLWRRAGRMVWLRQRGQMRQARVTAVAPTNLRVNGRVQWQIAWTDAAGGVGKSRRQPQDGLPPLGSEIMVFTDPTGKLPAVWDGDSGPR